MEDPTGPWGAYVRDNHGALRVRFAEPAGVPRGRGRAAGGGAAAGRVLVRCRCVQPRPDPSHCVFDQFGEPCADRARAAHPASSRSAAWTAAPKLVADRNPLANATLPIVAPGARRSDSIAGPSRTSHLRTSARPDGPDRVAGGGGGRGPGVRGEHATDPDLTPAGAHTPVPFARPPQRLLPGDRPPARTPPGPASTAGRPHHRSTTPAPPSRGRPHRGRDGEGPAHGEVLRPLGRRSRVRAPTAPDEPRARRVGVRRVHSAAAAEAAGAGPRRRALRQAGPDRLRTLPSADARDRRRRGPLREPGYADERASPTPSCAGTPNAATCPTSSTRSGSWHTSWPSSRAGPASPSNRPAHPRAPPSCLRRRSSACYGSHIGVDPAIDARSLRLLYCSEISSALQSSRFEESRR